MKSLCFGLILTMWLLLSRLEAKDREVHHMYARQVGTPEKLEGVHHLIYRGEKMTSGYNNHVYLAYHADRFWAMWSCSARDGGHTGQRIRYATSMNGTDWSSPDLIASPAKNEYLIARGLWMRNGELFALAARCTGEARETKIQALEAYRWNNDTEKWSSAGIIGRELINNYAPIHLDTEFWLMPYRFRELNRVDGVLVGGKKSLDSWQRIPFPGSAEARFTEANAVVRNDGTIAVHFRDNQRSGYLFRAVSRDGGKSFTQPTKTDFPDCRCKHYCLKLNNGLYVLINNPKSRKTLQVSGSADGIVFSRTAVLRQKPPAVRYPGHDKSPSFTYPHAVETDGWLYIAYSVSRDDIWLTRVSLESITHTLGEREPEKKSR